MLKLKLFTCIFVGVFALQLQGCAKKSMTAEQYLQSAKDFYAQEDYARARVQLRNAIREKDTLGEAYYYLALVAEQEDNIFIAFADINRAQELAPNNKAIAIKAAQYWVLTAQFAKAVTAMQALIDEAESNETKTPNNDERLNAYPVLAAGLIGLQRYNEALDYVESALAKMPAQNKALKRELLALKVVTLKFLQRLDEALVAVNQLITLAPNDASPMLLKLELNDLRGDNAGVNAALKRLIVLDPQQERYPLALAQRLYQRENSEQAVAVLERYNQQYPQNTLIKRALLELLEQDTPERAAQLLDVFLSQLPNDAGLIFYRASLLLRANQIADAEKVLKALVVRPQIDAATKRKGQLLLASIYRAGAKPNEALQVLDEALLASPLDIDLLKLRARVALDANRLAVALADANSVLTRYVDDIDALELVAHIYGLLGEREREVLAYERLLKLSPKHPKARSVYIRELIKAQKFTTAERYLSAADALYQSTPDWQLRRLELLMAQGDWQAAAQQLEALQAVTDLGWRRDFLGAKIFLGLGNNAQASLLFKQVIMAQPQYVEAYSGLASAQKPAEATGTIKWLDQVIAQDASAVPAYVLKAKLQSELGHNKAAISTYQKGINANIDWLQGYKLLADAYWLNRQGQAAVQVYDIALQKHSNNAFLLLSQAALYQKTNAFNRAVQNYELLLQQSDSRVVRNNYALLLVNDNLRTPQNIRKAASLTADFAETNNYALLDTYGWVQFWLGDLKAAENALKIALKQKDDIDIIYHLARVYKAQGNDTALNQLLETVNVAALPQATQKRFEWLML